MHATELPATFWLFNRPEQSEKYALLCAHMCSVVANRGCQSALSRDLIQMGRQYADDSNELSKMVMLVA